MAAQMLTAGEIAAALGGRRIGSNSYVACCPAHEDRSPSLSLTDTGDGLTLWHCHAGCSQRDVRDALVDRGLWPRPGDAGEPVRRGNPKRRSKPARQTEPPEDVEDRRQKALALWRRSRRIQGTIAEIYLRAERGITCALPATLRYLPGNDRYPPAMIAAFGLAHEPEPGVLAIEADAVRAVHLTKLTADGRKHPDEPGKIMIGSAPGVPIVLAPMNDLLGLAIAEGIEDALSIHQATGLGAWAAGSAGRMPAIAEAVPDYCDCVTVVADGDKAGTDNAEDLVRWLNARGIHAEMVPLVEAGR
jgi:hypothetical protein